MIDVGLGGPVQNKWNVSWGDCVETKRFIWNNLYT